MNSTEIAERRVMPVLMAFVAGVVVTTLITDAQLAKEREATARLVAAAESLDRCTRQLIDTVRSGAVPASDCRPQAPAARPYQVRQ